MNICNVLGFAVNNHTTGLVGIVSIIKEFTILVCMISQTSNTGRTNTDIKWLIKVPA